MCAQHVQLRIHHPHAAGSVSSNTASSSILVFTNFLSSLPARPLLRRGSGRLCKKSHPSLSFSPRASASISSSPRPVVILPGLGNSSDDYRQLVVLLEARGLLCEVADVARADWLRNAAGLLQADYWRGTLRPRPVLDWYLERVRAAVDAAKAKAAADGERRVSLVGHSAGGWLARLFMAEEGPADVAALITLGTPHRPPPADATGIVDQTRGLLSHMEATCPGAFHAPAVRYVCLSGRFIKGRPFFESAAEEPQPGAASSATAEASRAQRWQARLVGQGYKQVCGRSDAWGDGVVPEDSAHLPGALNLVLPGVYHSPVGASADRPWYGSAAVLAQWEQHLTDAA